uniref:peptide-methionine (S)-S-oxide reductase n=1 Tax=Electrophorus electricus TaxID=8005 RepID=A0A4W4GQ39_ELEEL
MRYKKRKSTVTSWLYSAGMGCFWGTDLKFWLQKGVYSIQVGYSGGYTPNMTYEEVCTSRYNSLAISHFAAGI